MFFLTISLFTETIETKEEIYDKSRNIFHCLSEDKNISLNKYNDGICDCCDGSDEFENPLIQCKNKCKINFTKINSTFIERYKSAIQSSKMNRKNSESRRKEMASTAREFTRKLLYYRSLQNNCLFDKSYYDYTINKRAYDILNEPIVNFSFENITNQTEIDEIIKKQKLKNAKLREDAIAAAFDLENYTFIKEFGELHQSRDNLNLSCNIYNEQVDFCVNMVMKMYNMQALDYGPDDEYIEYTLGKLTSTIIENGKNYLTIDNLRILSWGNDNSTTIYDQLVKIGNVFVFQSNATQIFMLKPICFDSIRPLYYLSYCDEKKFMVLGNPASCPTTYTDDGYVEFIRELQLWI